VREGEKEKEVEKMKMNEEVLEEVVGKKERS
jgi:hypothetical protein